VRWLHLEPRCACRGPLPQCDGSWDTNHEMLAGPAGLDEAHCVGRVFRQSRRQRAAGGPTADHYEVEGIPHIGHSDLCPNAPKAKAV
jgi:hypothetical protein